MWSYGAAPLTSLRSQGPIAALQVTGSVKELVREIPPGQLRDGVVDQVGNHTPGLMILLQTLAQRYGPLKWKARPRRWRNFRAKASMPYWCAMMCCDIEPAIKVAWAPMPLEQPGCYFELSPSQSGHLILPVDLWNDDPRPGQQVGRNDLDFVMECRNTADSPTRQSASSSQRPATPERSSTPARLSGRSLRLMIFRRGHFRWMLRECEQPGNKPRMTECHGQAPIVHAEFRAGDQSVKPVSNNTYVGRGAEFLVWIVCNQLGL